MIKEHKICNTNDSDLKTFKNDNENDEQFFNNLPLYTPLWYSNKGTPIFLANKTCPTILIPFLILVTLVALEIVLLFNKYFESSYSEVYTLILIIITGISFLILNISFLLTIYLNPGIKNLSRNEDYQVNFKNQEYCIRCEKYKTYEMTHCMDCNVCVEGLDHHCNVLKRCIGGRQKYAFFVFIAIVFIVFCEFYIVIFSQFVPL